MSPKITIHSYKKNLQSLSLNCQCSKCQNETNHSVLAKVELVDREILSYTNHPTYQHHQIAEFERDWYVDYEIIQCKGCETISFRRTIQDSGGDDTRIEFFPSVKQERETIPYSHNLPEKIQNIYKETLSALNHNEPILCGIGIRALIETITKDKISEEEEPSKSITSKDKSPLKDKLKKDSDNILSKKEKEQLIKLLNDEHSKRSNPQPKGLGQILGYLEKEKIITQDQLKVLHNVVGFTNEAAHDAKPHLSSQLNAAVTIVEHLLEGFYTIPDHAKKLS